MTDLTGAPARCSSGRVDSRRAVFALLVVILVLLASSPRTGAGLNEWTTAGPEGGRINALALDPRTSGVVYAWYKWRGSI